MGAEAMLLGAAIGGLTNKEDPLKGAVLGAFGGAVMPGISGGITNLLGSAAPAALGAETAAAATTAAGSSTAGNAALDAAMTRALPVTASTELSIPAAQNFASSGIPFREASQAANLASNASGLEAAMKQALPLSSNAGMGATTVGAAGPAMAPSGGGDMFSGLKDWYGNLPKGQQLGVLGAGGVGALMLGERMMAPKAPSGAYEGPLKKFRFDIAGYRPSMMADGGIASLRGADITVGGGMPRANPIDGSDSGMLNWQQRSSPEVHMASGGISDLGSYSDGGRMLRGPGDGMSDNIPGVIGGKQPARLADGEFVVPADVVSHLGNGSTDAGAKQLYSMMDRVRKARTGTKSQGRQINPMRQMPA